MANRIFCLMGKSSSGKDKIYKALMADNAAGLCRLVPYTTRPMRTGEEEGREYHFVTEEEYEKLHEGGKIAEERTYETACGLWRYFTAVDESVNLAEHSYILIGTLEAYVDLVKYANSKGMGEGIIEPIYIEVEDGERLARALKRERKQEEPKYAEMCRRFLADTADFAPEKLMKAGITDENTFKNPDGGLEDCIAEVREWIDSKISSDRMP